VPRASGHRSYSTRIGASASNTRGSLFHSLGAGLEEQVPRASSGKPSAQAQLTRPLRALELDWRETRAEVVSSSISRHTSRRKYI
jgi:hypothetical protein